MFRGVEHLKLQKQLKELNGQIKVFSEQMALKDREILVLKDNVAQLSDQLKDTSDVYIDKLEKLDRLKGEYDNIKEKLVDKNIDYDAEEKAAHSKRQTMVLKAQMHQLQNTLIAKSSEFYKLKKELKKIKKGLKQANSELKSSNEANSALKLQLEQARIMLSAHKRSELDDDDPVLGLADQLIEANKDLKVAQKEISKRAEIISVLERKVDRLENQLK